MLLAWLYLLLPALFAVLVLGPWGASFSQLPWRILLFAAICSLGFLALRRFSAEPANSARGWLGRLAAPQEPSAAWVRNPFVQVEFTVLFYAALYRLAAFLPEISTYPLSLGWSEVSRFYNASLFFAPRVYGVSTPPSVLHPTRYLMQSLAFLIPDAPLWFHRLWQVLLWWVLTLATAVILVRRVDRRGSLRMPGLIFWSLVGWAVLMFFQGPVYYHLLVMVILVLLGTDTRRPVRTGMVVLLASLWAGISRVNWIPMPALLATALYLLEVPVGQKPWWRCLLQPAAWCLAGTLVAFASERVYVVLSGNPAEQFGSSFSSDLLWYRLLPNPTYPIGILPASLLACGGAGLFLLYYFYLRRREQHLLRWSGLAGILSVLFAGGILVSVKIGGGSNLHNLDAFLVMLVLVVAYIAAGRFQAEHDGNIPQSSSLKLPLPAVVLLAAAGLTPVIFALAYGSPAVPRDHAAAQEVIDAVRSEAQRAAAQGREVLFINQRHLLTFHQVESVPLVPDYELVFLMEMTMSGNQPYLDEFHRKLQDQQFGLIVVEPLKEVTYGRSHNFGEENDAWVVQVSQPVLCYYETTQDFEALGVMLMTPRQQPCR